MDRPKLYKTEAIVLKHIPLGEADRILTVYTPELGKLRLVAKGVRRPTSKLGGHVEPLNHVTLSVARGQNLDIATQGQTLHSFRSVREDLRSLSWGFYIADLVDQFAPDESPNFHLFELMLRALGWLEKGTQTELLLRFFEMRLLGYTGYQPELYWCVECRRHLDPGNYAFSCSLGGVTCSSCEDRPEGSLLPASLNTMKVLRFLQREEYTAVTALHISVSLHREVERLLSTYIRYLLEREVKSASFMKVVASEMAALQLGE
ncbi:MAG: DNA repair protein RecO [Chloroflexi bacterium]|nr:DNA repair protein RecO [Chloroflexota bacterium]